MLVLSRGHFYLSLSRERARYGEKEETVWEHAHNRPRRRGERERERDLGQRKIFGGATSRPATRSVTQPPVTARATRCGNNNHRDARDIRLLTRMLLFGGGGATHKYTSGFSRGVMRAHHGWNDPLRVVWARAIYAARPVRVCIYISIYTIMEGAKTAREYKVGE